MEESRTIAKNAEGFVARKDWNSAAIAYHQLASQMPLASEVWYLYGRVLMELGQFGAALQRFDRAATLTPREARYHRARGDGFLALGALPEAEEAYRCALQMDPEDIFAMINLGNAVNKQGRPNGALAHYGRALAINPGNVMCLNNIGKTWHDLGDYHEAEIWYEKALQKDPDYAEARFNRAAALLTQCDFVNGWREYEWRFRRFAGHRVYPHKLEGPRWHGEPFQGKRLLVHCEQGMGDVIQFCRYLPMVKAFGGTVILEVHKPLLSLLRGMACIDRIIPFDRHAPTKEEYDLHIPLMSLPHIFGTTIESIPAPIPYLQPGLAAVSRWKSILRTTCERPRIGIIWAGSSTDQRRSCPWAFVAAFLGKAKGVQFFSLQKELPPDVTTDQLDRLQVTHWGDLLTDFHETAAAIYHLDLVISIDTAAAHLAGAIGKPLWLILPYSADWRWLTDRSDTPWYPTARIFRQSQCGNWWTVFSPLLKAIDALARMPGPQGYLKYTETVEHMT